MRTVLLAKERESKRRNMIAHLLWLSSTEGTACRQGRSSLCILPSLPLGYNTNIGNIGKNNTSSSSCSLRSTVISCRRCQVPDEKSILLTLKRRLPNKKCDFTLHILFDWIANEMAGRDVKHKRQTGNAREVLMEDSETTLRSN